MRSLITTLIILTVSALPARAQPPTTGFCVENNDDRAALFAVDAGNAFRTVAILAPGERLCTPEFAEPTGGFVSIFLNEDAIEGCSRLAPAGSVQGLLKYHDFDNCAWQISP
ncbi:MAG: hypothetical protein GQ535_15135 [Rhodobacteraceae bacterium]|nr:hypothetical protein [Paracoccaceae bacterium]